MVIFIGKKRPFMETKIGLSLSLNLVAETTVTLNIRSQILFICKSKFLMPGINFTLCYITEVIMKCLHKTSIYFYETKLNKKKKNFKLKIFNNLKIKIT